MFCVAIENRAAKCIRFLASLAQEGSFSLLMCAAAELGSVDAIYALLGRGAKVEKWMLDLAIDNQKYEAATVLNLKCN